MSQRKSNESVAEWSRRLQAESAAERAATQETIANARQKARAQTEAREKEHADLEQARGEAFQQQRTAEFDKMHKNGYRNAFIGAGGNGEAFDTLWEKSLRDEARLEITKRQSDQRRAAMRAMTHAGF